MKRSLAALAFHACTALAQGQINLYCSSPNTAWCQGMAVGFERQTGTRVAVIQKATGEMLAQIKAEKDNPKGDVWWAGAGDSYLQAAEEGLLEAYRSPNVVLLVALPPQVPKLTDIRIINYDFARYGASSERKRLLERWEKDVNAAAK